MLYRRRLPHWIPEETPLFVTWRLAGSIPRYRELGFLEQDACDDRQPIGPLWLSDPRIARMVMNALVYGEQARHMYRLYAFVIMSNHVHVVWLPLAEHAKIMDWLKAATARRANAILGRTGQRFWQVESYDHWIRDGKEFDRLVAYVEQNPVSAGLVKSAEEWPWSSAHARDGSQQDWLRYSP